MQHWTVQPPPGTPLNARLGATTLYLPGMPEDYSMTATGGGGSLTTSDGMLRRSFAASNAGLYRTTHAHERTGSAALLWVGELLGTPTAGAKLGGLTYRSANTSPYGTLEIKRRRTVTNDIYLFHSLGTAENYVVSGGLAAATGKVVVVGSVSPGAQRLYVLDVSTGAVYTASGTVAGSLTPESTARYEVGDGFNARNPNAACEMMVLFNRGLSDDECLMLLNNPYAAFAPRRTARIYTFGPPAAGGDTSISATSQALALTANAASVAFDKSISTTSQALTLTTYPATVAFDVSIAASSQALALTANAATITLGTAVDATSQALSLTANPASVAFDVSISATSQAMSLTTYQASVVTGTAISAATQALSLTAYAASIAYDVGIAASLDALLLTTYAASVQSGTVAAIPVAVFLSGSSDGLAVKEGGGILISGSGAAAVGMR